MCFRDATERRKGWPGVAGKCANRKRPGICCSGHLTRSCATLRCAAMITLTPRAAKQVRTMHAELNAPDKRLRVFVESGGCSGFQYGMSFDAPKPEDQVLESEGVAILI